MVLGSDRRKCVTDAVVPPADGRTEAPLQPKAATTKLPVPVTIATTTAKLQTDPTSQAAATAQGTEKAPGYALQEHIQLKQLITNMRLYSHNTFTRITEM